MKHFALIATCVALFTFGGCVEDLKTIKHHSAQAAAWLEKADSKIDELESRVAQLPEGDKLHRLKTELADLRDERKKVHTALQTANGHIQDAKEPEDLLGVGVQAAMPFLGPYGGIASLAASIIGGLLAHMRMKKKGVAAIRNIDHIINHPELGGGAGKFDATDPATIAEMKRLDHESGAMSLVRNALG